MSKESGLTKRQKSIIKMLIQFSADNPITIQAISAKLKLSSRTILREMPDIDRWFEENDFQLIKKPRVGLYVKEDQETRKFIGELVEMDHDKFGYSKEDRQGRIISDLLMLNEPLKYFYFTSLFRISDGTLTNDLDEIEQWMSHYNLSLVRKPGIGIYWTGKEEDYRQAVTMMLRRKLEGHMLSELFHNEEVMQGGLFSNVTQDFFNEAVWMVQELQNLLDIQYTERSIRHLSLYFMVAKSRISQGLEVDSDGKNLAPMMHLPECQMANWIGSKISYAVGHQVSEGEVYCIAMQLLTAKIWKNKHDSKYDEESFRVRQIVIKITLNMEKLLDMEFLGNTVLIDGLCNHMKPAVNRIRMGLFVENTHMEMLREKYMDVYQAAVEACGFLKEELQVSEISEEELGFIAMYFCAFIEKQKEEDKHFRVYVACPHGIGTSQMLSVYLKRDFPQLRIQKIISSADIKVEELVEEEIDLVISTTELDLAFPNVYVSSMLTETDKVMIKTALSNIRKKHKKKPIKGTRKSKKIRRRNIQYMVTLGQEILQVLDNIKLSIGENLQSKADLIEYAGTVFARSEEDAGKITAELYKREELASTFIPGMNVLFLHSETKGVKHCRFGYIYLKEPIAEQELLIRGAVLMLIPKEEGNRVFREVMSEVSGALAEKDQIITYLFQKNRKAVEAELEASLGSYFEKIMKRE
ncbi:MAG: BglG family transcription antiterminator [Anaerostipes sp.]|uniref:BglG family transcription antiterminator n=1 Tax=Anaerostipes sp. TaxID=1872530 RepID=UPI00399599D6